MKQIHQYSSLFSCLHDEREPIGSLGRGTHHSIFRCAQWRDITLLPERPAMQDFCVVWDEDHDERVIAVIERIYMEDLLSPIMFIGERKGGLNVIVREDFIERTCDEAFRDYSNMVAKIADSLADPWGCSVGTFSRSSTPEVDVRKFLVNDDAGRVGAYLAGIDACWSLGLKPFTFSRVSA